MFKAIIWQNSIHILGPATSIDIEATAVKLTSQSNLIILRYAENAILATRCKEDAQFKQLLPRIIMRHLVDFLLNEKMTVLDLAVSVLKTQIVVEPPPAAIEDNGLVPVQNNAV